MVGYNRRTLSGWITKDMKEGRATKNLNPKDVYPQSRRRLAVQNHERNYLVQ